MERFSSLEKVEFPAIEGFEQVLELNKYCGTGNIIIPVKKASFYELYDYYKEHTEEFKIFNDENEEFWMVKVK